MGLRNIKTGDTSGALDTNISSVSKKATHFVFVYIHEQAIDNHCVMTMVFDSYNPIRVSFSRQIPRYDGINQALEYWAR